MKNIIKTIVYTATIMLFFSPGEVRADELLRYHSGGYASPGSIIRHYKQDLDIVCYQGSGGPYFMMFNTSSGVSNEFYLDNIDTIYDFEIYDDTIYFCGDNYASVAGAAVIGFFDVATLSSTTPSNVAYLPLPIMRVVTAIEVDYFASRKHVVGIGESIESKSMIVDMIDELSYWNVNFGEVGGDTSTLHDLKILNGYVVVTSTRPESILPSFTVQAARLWYIAKPTLPGNSLFPGATYYKNVHRAYSVIGKIMIETMRDGDKFVTAYKKDLYDVTTSNPFIVSYYNGLSYINSVEMNANQGDKVRLADIEYSVDCHTVEMLLCGMCKFSGGSYPRSVIYEIPNAPLPSTLMAHAIDGIYFESLDNVWEPLIGAISFVSAGYKSSSLIPYFLKFSCGVFLDCMERINFTCEEIQISQNQYEGYAKYTRIFQLPELQISYNKSVFVEDECESTSKNDE